MVNLLPVFQRYENLIHCYFIGENRKFGGTGGPLF